LVQSGDTIAIDSALYQNDAQVQWAANNLYIHGVGGRPRLEAGALIANDPNNGKGIFVISGNNVLVENIEFANAAVIDLNGAGIRQEGKNLTVRSCFFNHNEMGILCGAISNCNTTLEYNVFSNNGNTSNPGYQHNIYIGHIDTFFFRYNYTKDAIGEGHELKSRARVNLIQYNRISNETTFDSRSIDLPNGGVSIIMGNIIEQSNYSVNNNLVGYGLEGLSNAAPHRCYVVNNTFINRKPNGNFIQVQSGMDTLFVKNNLFCGANTGGIITGSAVLDTSHNLEIPVILNAGFVNSGLYDYHLLSTASAINAGSNNLPGVGSLSLVVTKSYVYNASGENRISDGLLDMGAFEFYNPTGLVENQASRFVLYPNPCEARLTVQTEQEQEFPYEIMNLFGETLVRGQIRGTSDLSTAMLQPGLYMLHLQGEYLPFQKR
jgi:hypothetical protein